MNNNKKTKCRKQLIWKLTFCSVPTWARGVNEADRRWSWFFWLKHWKKTFSSQLLHDSGEHCRKMLIAVYSINPKCWPSLRSPPVRKFTHSADISQSKMYAIRMWTAIITNADKQSATGAKLCSDANKYFVYTSIAML